MNEIAQIKLVAVNGPKGPAMAMMMALNVGDATTADAFVAQVVREFKLRRTLAPPNNTILLVTIIGNLSAEQFAAHWQTLIATDEAARAYMSLMQVAEVVQGTPAGQQLSRASILPPPSRRGVC